MNLKEKNRINNIDHDPVHIIFTRFYNEVKFNARFDILQLTQDNIQRNLATQMYDNVLEITRDITQDIL